MKTRMSYDWRAGRPGGEKRFKYYFLYCLLVGGSIGLLAVIVSPHLRETWLDALIFLLTVVAGLVLVGAPMIWVLLGKRARG